MLSREEKNRPDWLELEERVIKEEETRMSQANISRESNVYRQPERAPPRVNYNQPPPTDTRFSSREPKAHLVTSNAVPVYQDPAYRQSQRAFFAQSGSQSSAVRSPLNESNTKSGDSSLPQFKPSTIESTRPLRNIFPANFYTTMTKVDENLIVVAEEDRFSDIDTPNNRNHVSYF
jgi:hypothetical protein